MSESQRAVSALPSQPYFISSMSLGSSSWEDPRGFEGMGLGLGVWQYLSSARMPTERDASAVTASTSASAPGTLGSQESGQEAKCCMQPQYFPRTRSWVSRGKTSCLSYILD